MTVAAKAKAVLLKLADAARKLLPGFLKGREKAIAAFVTPLVAFYLMRFVNLDIPASLVEQLVLAVITSFTVHAATNKPEPVEPEPDDLELDIPPAE